MLALGVLTLILGVAVLIWPGDSIVVASVVFGVYLLVSGIAQAIAAFTVGMSPGQSRPVLHQRRTVGRVGLLRLPRLQQRRRRVAAGHCGSALDSYSKVSRRRCWRSVPRLPARGWYIFVGILTVIAGVVTIVWPISSIVVLAIFAGSWLVVVGTTEVVWALSARSTVKNGERRIEALAPSAAS